MAASKNIRLKDLLEAGLLSSGETLTCQPSKGGRYVACLNSDGTIIYNGQSFGSPSKWAGQVTGRSTNGWKHVFARDKKLDTFRQKLSAGTKSPPEDVKTESLPPSLSKDEARGGIVISLYERILGLSPGKFEVLVGEFLKAQGFSEVKVTGHSNDGGIDGYCEMPFINVKVAFQAKRYAPRNRVGIDPVQRLQGSMTHAFDRGVFITTSTFSPAATEWVKEKNAAITLIDGDELGSVDIYIILGICRQLNYLQNNGHECWSSFVVSQTRMSDRSPTVSGSSRLSSG